MDNSRTIKNNIIAIFININYIPNNLIGEKIMKNWFTDFNELKTSIEDFYDYQIEFYYKDKLCVIERDNSPQAITKYGQDVYYLKGWEKDMKKTFLSLDELSQDPFFEGKTLIEVWNNLKFDNTL